MPNTSVSKENIIKWRRHFHQNPELSFQEYQTVEYIQKILEDFPNLEIIKPTDTSIIAILDTGKPGKTIALRADIDALPIEETSGVSFTSKNAGVMHACGHDAHTAMLLGAVEVLSQEKENLTGKVKFIFQHAEEKAPGGARELVELGHLSDVDFIFGQHVTNGVETGTFGIHTGPANAATDDFQIKIIGKGGHAAAPEYAIDPILIGAEIITSLYHIPIKHVNAFESVIITVGEMTAGKATNVIPETAFLQGTVRTHRKKTQKIVEEQIRQIVKYTVAKHGAKYELAYTYNTDVVMNDALAASIAQTAAQKVVGKKGVYTDLARMGGEDFASYTNVVPGVFCRLGTGDGASAHNPYFTIDEAALPIGAQFFVQIVLDVLGEND